MSFMDRTRRKAVLNVVTSFVPWAKPHMERWEGPGQDILVVDVVGPQRLVLFLENRTGAWFWNLCVRQSGVTVPHGLPMPLGLSRSNGGQDVAGTFVANLMDTLAAAVKDPALPDQDRREANRRFEQLLAMARQSEG